MTAPERVNQQSPGIRSGRAGHELFQIQAADHLQVATNVGFGGLKHVEICVPQSEDWPPGADYVRQLGLEIVHGCGHRNIWRTIYDADCQRSGATYANPQRLQRRAIRRCRYSLDTERISKNDTDSARALHGVDKPSGYGYGVDFGWIRVFFVTSLGTGRITDLRYQDGANHKNSQFNGTKFIIEICSNTITMKM